MLGLVYGFVDSDGVGSGVVVGVGVVSVGSGVCVGVSVGSTDGVGVGVGVTGVCTFLVPTFTTFVIVAYVSVDNWIFSTLPSG